MTVTRIWAIFVITIFLYVASKAQTTEFTYQGSLASGGMAANGNFDLEFKLFDALSGGGQQGPTLQRLSIAVANGIFSVSLDFGSAALPGADRFLDISVRPAGGGAFTPLSPRQKLGSAPYAIKSLSSATADNATNASQLGGVAAAQYVVTTDPRMSDARNPLPNSGNYIQNQNAAAQTSSNFNISGTGTAGIFNAATQYNIGGSRALSTAGTNNVFAGINAGAAIAGTQGNSFFGRDAGIASTTGGLNTFIGWAAGNSNISGGRMTLLGAQTDSAADLNNATAIGYQAYVGQSNSLILGSINGVNGSALDTNVGIGTATPVSKLHLGGNSSNFAMTFTNSANTAGRRGYRLAFDNDRLTFQRADDSGAFLTNQMMIDQASGNVGIGTVSAAARLNVAGGGFGANVIVTDSNTTATTLDLSNTSTGGQAWRLQSLGSATPSRVGNFEIWEVGGTNALTVTPTGNVGLGTTVPGSRLHIADSNGSIFLGGGCQPASTAISFVTSLSCTNYALRGDGVDTSVNAAVGGEIQIRFGGTQVAVINTAGSLGLGTTNPSSKLHVVGDVRLTGSVIVGTLPGGGAAPICGNAGAALAFCSSSLRYKTNLGGYSAGLSLVERLRPITFDWKSSGMHDLGLAAEDVAEVEPLLVTYNQSGQIEGVKYDRLGIVLINAIKEQQATIEYQRRTNEAQQKMITDLERRLAALENGMKKP